MLTMQVYPDSSGAFRWRLKAENGQIVAVSGESFDSKSNAKRAAKDFITAMSGRVLLAA